MHPVVGIAASHADDTARRSDALLEQMAMDRKVHAPMPQRAAPPPAIAGDKLAPQLSLCLPFGRALPTLAEDEPRIAAMLAPLGKTGTNCQTGRSRHLNRQNPNPAKAKP